MTGRASSSGVGGEVMECNGSGVTGRAKEIVVSKQDHDQTMTVCPNCGGKLKELSRERILPDPDFTGTSDKELVEFFWEDITGNYEK